jgi:hypothetical protein
MIFKHSNRFLGAIAAAAVVFFMIGTSGCATGGIEQPGSTDLAGSY